jgi:hypothetical protein
MTTHLATWGFAPIVLAATFVLSKRHIGTCRMLHRAGRPREGDACALQIPALGEVRERAAQDADRQDPALQAEAAILTSQES